MDNGYTRQRKVTQVMTQYDTLPKIKILTPSGWSDFDGVRQISANKTLRIETNFGSIQCTYDHKMKMEDNSFKNAIYLKVGDVLAQGFIITKIVPIKWEKPVYDAVNVEKGNQFYANGMVVSNCIMLSTPRGIGNTFHRLWVQAEQGNNKFNTIQLPWTVHPDRDQNWRDQQTIALTEKKAAQECDCNFATSGDNVIPGHILQAMAKQTIKDPIEKMFSDNLWLWEYPQTDKEYILSADVARGDGTDFSAFHVISIDDNEQVGQYKAKIGTQQYGRLIVRVAKMFNNAYVVVENASIGWAVLQQILDLGYKNIYYHKKDYKYIDKALHSKARMNKRQDEQKDIVGFSTSSRTRPLIVQRMSLALENKQIIIHSKRLMNQFWTFIWLNGKPQAMRSYNDDLVMSLAIGIWVRNTSYIISKQGKAFSRRVLASIQSGLNRKHGSQKKISTGFFNANNNYDRVKNNILNVGGQDVDLLKFYFPQRQNNNKKETE